jgi:hypothetical protein
MKLVLHIFKKDVRRLRLEILISLSLMTAVVWMASSRWMTDQMLISEAAKSSAFAASTLAGILIILVPLNWWWLIAPVIHGERLVGDQQYWLTRPYTWTDLLAAKALFLIAFLYTPLLLAQFILLREAGFLPFHYLPGVLYNLLLLSGVLILPLAALATVTRNIGEMVLAVLGIAISAIGISLLSMIIPSTNVGRSYSLIGSLSLLICGCIGVVLWQYASRKTEISRVVILLVLLAVGMLAIGVPDQAWMVHAYSRSGGVTLDSVHFSVPTATEGAPSAFVPRLSGEVGIRVPVDVSGVPAGTLLLADDVKISIDAPGGLHWESLWQPLASDKILPATRRLQVGFSLPRRQYEKFKELPITMHLTFAMTQEKALGVARASMGEHDFSVPGFGICSAIPGEHPDEIGSLECRTALREPRLTLIQTVWSYSSCGASSAEVYPEDRGWTWVGSKDRSMRGLGIAPGWVARLWFDRDTPHRTVKQLPHFCSGTPILFTPYDVVGRTQVSFDAQGLRLPELPRGLANVIDHP